MQALISRWNNSGWHIYISMLRNQILMDLRTRYTGTLLGLLWAVIGPLLWTGIFSFVIVFVFKVRLNIDATPWDYVLFILCGMVPWLAFQESLNNATSSIVANSNIVKNLPFPLEIFPISGILTSLVTFAVGLVLILTGLLFSGHVMGWSLFFLPLAIGIQVLFALGFGFFLASTNVFVRDTGYLLTYVLMMVLYISPIVYDAAMTPAILQKVILINPVYHFIDMYRAIFLRNQWPNLYGTLYLILFSLLNLVVGYRFFRRTKPYFADYLA